MKFKKTSKNAIQPLRGTVGSAGADLSTVRKEIIKPREFKMIDLGVAFDIPDGHMLMLCSRSSIPVKKNLIIANGFGVIDSDYTGELKVVFYNPTEKDVILEENERVAQVVLVKVETPALLETTEIKKTVRADGGFGSTNKS